MSLWWALLECDDGTKHIMPYVPVDLFRTKAEAAEYAAKLEAAGDVCVTDDEQIVIGAYFGHKLGMDCACTPKRIEHAGIALIIHEVIQ